MASSRNVQIAFVSQVEELSTNDLRRVIDAIQTQIDRDLAPVWEVEATLGVVPTATDVPPDAWAVIIDREAQPGTAGYHGERDGTPFAMVAYNEATSVSWTVTASHQCLEMLVDPRGNRLVSTRSPKPDQGRARVLVQICDPCQADDFGYTIDGVRVSDFVTPAYYANGDGKLLDFRGEIEQPLTLLKGGYISWQNPDDGHWWQELWFGDEPMFRDLGSFESNPEEAEQEPEPEPKPPPRRRRKRADEPQPEPDALGALPGAVNDRVTAVDLLGFRDYVVAFADLIESPRTEPPITIGIYGAWGSGKSFLLQNIGDELLQRNAQRRANGDTEFPHLHLVRFNAWEYNSSAAIWPSLVRKILVCVEKELRWPFPGRFLRKLWRNLAWELRQERGKVLGALVSAVLLLALVLWQLDFHVGTLAAAAAALGAAGFLKVVADTLSSPLSRWMTTLLASGEYGEPMGYMSRIQADLEQLSRQLERERGRFVVMIDDLDRCEPDKVVEVLQAINLLLSFESFIVCLGIDARIVTGAIERHYEGLLRNAGASGYEYLDKIVQIPFRIPRPNAHEVEAFVTTQLREAVVAVNGTPAATAPPGRGSPSPPPSEQRSAPAAALSQTPDVPAAEGPAAHVAFDAKEIAAFADVASFLEPNPRHLKRLINVYRLVRSLAGVRHVDSSVRRDPEGVILLLTLAAQWPYTAASMLDRIGPIVEAEAQGHAWPDGSPLLHLHQVAELDAERQRELDRDLGRLDELLARADGHLPWKTLGSLQRYVVNFNPAVEEELRRGRQMRERSPTGE